jgi:hypothetical protein
METIGLSSADCPDTVWISLFYDTTTYGPVRGGHDRVSGANGSMARSIDESDNVRQYGVVVRSYRLIERLLPSHVASRLATNL